jgi:hypothetical protein
MDMPTKSRKPKHPGRRGLTLSLGGRTADEAVKTMFRLTPEQSRKIIASTSVKSKASGK